MTTNEKRKTINVLYIGLLSFTVTAAVLGIILGIILIYQNV